MNKYDGTYSSYYNTADESYPEGSAVDATSSETYDGTPYKAAFFNDVIGFFQAAFHKAFGNPYTAGETVTRSVSGDTETATTSDVLDALEEIMDSKVPELSYNSSTEALTLAASS